MRRTLLFLAGGLVLVGSNLPAQHTRSVPLPPYRTNGFFVSYHADDFYGTGELEMLQDYYGCNVRNLTTEFSLCDTTFVIEWWEGDGSAELDIPAVTEDFEGVPGVTVTPNLLYRVPGTVVDSVIESQTPYITPNDSLFPLQWHLQDEHCGMRYAWKNTLGSRSVVVGILDTGVWMDHEDLSENLWVNPGEDLNGDGVIQQVEMNGIDDDSNQFVDDFYGWDFLEDDNDPDHSESDNDFHGTKVAGVSSAATYNYIGIAGVGWSCSYMPLRAGEQQGLYLEYIVPAMLYAIQKQVDVLNCSWYNYYSNQILAELTECLYETGTVVVACAGNNNVEWPAYPAAYEWVVGVAATGEEKELTPFSNYGEWLHIAAPGSSILTTTAFRDDQGLSPTYGFVDGTSFSAPLVSGAAALVRSLRPGWGPQQVMTRLYATTQPIEYGGHPPGRAIDGGLLDVYGAVNIPGFEFDPVEESVED